MRNRGTITMVRSSAERPMVDADVCDDRLQRIVAIGFRQVGNWQLREGRLVLDLLDATISCNTLYAYVVNDVPMYVGKSVGSLKNRLIGYINPPEGQRTNIRLNKLLRDCLARGANAVVYALPDTGLIMYGGFHLNLAAGLEDSLIGTLKPEWNMTGTKRSA